MLLYQITLVFALTSFLFFYMAAAKVKVLWTWRNFLTGASFRLFFLSWNRIVRIVTNCTTVLTLICCSHIRRNNWHGRLGIFRLFLIFIILFLFYSSTCLLKWKLDYRRLNYILLKRLSQAWRQLSLNWLRSSESLIIRSHSLCVIELFRINLFCFCRHHYTIVWKIVIYSSYMIIFPLSWFEHWLHFWDWLG